MLTESGGIGPLDHALIEPSALEGGVAGSKVQNSCVIRYQYKTSLAYGAARTC